VEDAGAAMETALALTRDEERRRQMGESALAFVQAHRGATRRLVDQLEAVLAKRR
jgi:3-deoxy-D-manno-octulosonic-acid transferase